jgi:hypothetical protein
MEEKREEVRQRRRMVRTGNEDGKTILRQRKMKTLSEPECENNQAHKKMSLLSAASPLGFQPLRP